MALQRGSVSSPMLEEAIRVGDCLCLHGVRRSRGLTWPDYSLEWGPRGEVTGTHSRDCSSLLYDGTSGIALFLAELFAVTGREKFRTAALECFATDVEQLTEETSSLAFYAGLTGTAHAASEVARLTASDRTYRIAQELVELIGRTAFEDKKFDVIAGSAGAVPILIRLMEEFPSTALLRQIERARDFLLNGAIRLAEGWCWPWQGPSSRPLTGYAHGASGVAVALAELSHFLSSEACAHAAIRAIQYEDHHFNSQTENWPDFRHRIGALSTTPRRLRSGMPLEMTAWCHGAPGIGLARMRCEELLGVRGSLRAIRAALRTTLSSLRERHFANACLCHGVMGNLLAANTMARYLGEHEAQKEIEGIRLRVLDRYAGGRSDWPSALRTGGAQRFGLMTGLAGIGLSLLSYHRDVPTVLLATTRTIVRSDRRMLLGRAGHVLAQKETETFTRHSRRFLASITRLSHAEGKNATVSRQVSAAVNEERGRCRLRELAKSERHALAAEMGEERLRARSRWRSLDHIGMGSVSVVGPLSPLRASLLVTLVCVTPGRIVIDPPIAKFRELLRATEEIEFILSLQTGTAVESTSINLLSAATLVASRPTTTARKLVRRAARLFPDLDGVRLQSLLSEQVQKCVDGGLIEVRADARSN